MDNETKKPAIIAAWNGVSYYKESGDDRADYPFEEYAKDAGACGVGYCYNFCPPFARAMPTNSTQPLIDNPKIAWGVAAFLMGYAYKDAGGVLHFHLQDAGYKSTAQMFREYAAAARRVRKGYSTLKPNGWGNMAKIVAADKRWHDKHGEEEAAALARTRAADHGAAGELWREVEPIAEQYAKWIKGGCVVDDEAAGQKRGGRKNKPFSACVIDGTRAAEVTAKLHELMGDKRGKDACLIIAGAIKAEKITKPTHLQFSNEFGDIVCYSEFYRFLDAGNKVFWDEAPPISAIF